MEATPLRLRSLYAAIRADDLVLFSALLKDKIPVNFQPYFCHEHENPLYVACESGSATIISYILNIGGWFGVKSDQDTNMLHVACFRGHLDAVETLLPWVKSKSVITGVQSASKIQDPGENSAYPSVTSPLATAKRMGWVDIVDVLRARMAELEKDDENRGSGAHIPLPESVLITTAKVSSNISFKDNTVEKPSNVSMPFIVGDEQKKTINDIVQGSIATGNIKALITLYRKRIFTGRNMIDFGGTHPEVWHFLYSLSLICHDDKNNKDYQALKWELLSFIDEEGTTDDIMDIIENLITMWDDRVGKFAHDESKIKEPWACAPGAKRLCFGDSGGKNPGNPRLLEEVIEYWAKQGRFTRSDILVLLDFAVTYESNVTVEVLLEAEISDDEGDC
jgi:hypothetical protein